MKIVLIFFLLAFNLAFNLRAQAAVTNFVLSGTSQLFDITQSQDAWGVMAGPNHDPDGVITIDPTKPYNSCQLPTAPKESTSFPILPCHPNRVDGPTEITISFNEDSDEFTGFKNATAVFTPIGTSSNLDPQDTILARNENQFAQGQTATLKFTWDDVCRIVFEGTMNDEGLCVDNSTTPPQPLSGDVQIRIGLSDNTDSLKQISSQTINFKLYTPDKEIGILPLGDNGKPCDFTNPPTTTASPDRDGTELTGVCDILPIPGDGGAFLEVTTPTDPITPDAYLRQTKSLGSRILYTNSFSSAGTTDTGTNLLSLSYKAIRLYFFKGSDLKTFLPFSTQVLFVDLPVSSFSPISLNENYISGLENGVTYTVLAASVDESGTVSQFFLPSTSSLNGTSQGYCDNGFCPQITPSKVAGVIAESDCFITTATYSSEFSYQVKTFKNFREKFLRNHPLGDKIIKLYDNYGPYAAVFINENGYLKLVIRGLLFPLYLFSKLSLSIGVINALALFLLGAFILALTTLSFLRCSRRCTQGAQSG